MRDDPKLLTLVVPVFNEAALVATSLPEILRAVASAAPRPQVALVAVDDGSTDGTWAALAQLAAQDARISRIGFTRNFGKEAAVHAGLQHACDAMGADVVVVIDADLQHPPALVGQMLARWREGCDVVEGVKRNRGDESAARRWAANAFYSLFTRLSGLRLQQATDFKLLDRRVAQAVLQLGERGRFFRGIVQWLGFPSAQVEFDVAARAGGASAWSTLSLARYAWRNLTSFSSAPLGIVTTLGGIGLAFGVVLGAKALLDKLQGRALDGFSTVILLQILFGSLILLSLGIIGSYIARIYEELKRRPLYVLRPGETRGPGGPQED